MKRFDALIATQKISPLCKVSFLKKWQKTAKNTIFSKCPFFTVFHDFFRNGTEVFCVVISVSKCFIQAFFVPLSIFFYKYFLCIFAIFWHFLATFNNFVCCNDSERQTKIRFSQWISATNKTNLFHSGSVQQTTLKKYPISVWHVTKELEKERKNNKNILLNLNFTAAIKLLWETISIGTKHLIQAENLKYV